jgi:hypothetical protein
LSLRRLLLALPVAFGVAAVVAAAPSAAPVPAPAADRTLPANPALRSLAARAAGGHLPDALGPVLKGVHGPFRPRVPGRDQSKDPTPDYSEAERAQLVREGKELFFSSTAFGQQDSQGPRVSGLRLSCATCHVSPAQVDGLTHVVGPVR